MSAERGGTEKRNWEGRLEGQNMDREDEMLTDDRFMGEA